MDAKTNEIKSFSVEISLNDALIKGVIDTSYTTITIGGRKYNILKNHIRVKYANEYYTVLEIIKQHSVTYKAYIQIDKNIVLKDASALIITLEVLLKSDISHLKYCEQTKLEFDGEKG